MTKLFLSVLESSVSVSLIIIVMVLLSPFLDKRYAAKWKYWIWIFLALWLLMPFSGMNGKSIADIVLQRKMQMVSESEKSDMVVRTDEIISKQVIVEIPIQITTPIVIESEKSNVSITLLDIMAIIWIIGSLVFLLVHFISYFHYKSQVIQKGKIIEDRYILYQVLKLKQELQIRGMVPVIEFSEAVSPMVIGFFKPVLVLPKEQYSSEELFFILKHELVHLKRKDVSVKLLFVVINAIYWFHPLIWIMQKEADVNMELSCDERVTQDADYRIRKAYTETLFATLYKQYRKRTSLSIQFYGGKQIMKKRLKNILTSSRKKNGFYILIGAVILTINFGSLINCSVAKEKPSTLVSEDGYSFYLPDGEWQKKEFQIWYALSEENGQKDWKKEEIPVWYVMGNEEIRFWAAHFDSAFPIEQMLTDTKEKDKAYHLENGELVKQEDEIIYRAKLHNVENYTWCVGYCYPMEVEEEWGSELSAVADTFVITVSKKD